MLLRPISIAFLVSTFPAVARADDSLVHEVPAPSSHPAMRDWLVAEAPVALDVSRAQGDPLASGTMPALGLYRDNGRGALGLRMRAGIVHESSDAMSSPGYGSLGTLGLAMRRGVAGGWFEVVGGLGYTHGDVVPAFEAGAGWNFAVGAIDVGPSVRLLLVDGSPSGTGRTDMVLFGADVYFGRHARPGRHPVIDPAWTPVADGEPAARPEDPVCASDRAVCELALTRAIDAGQATLEGDRIVLDDRAVFEDGGAQVHAQGRAVLGAIARRWQAHPEWLRIRIADRAEPTGALDPDLALHRRRGQQARALLVRYGFSPERIELATATSVAAEGTDAPTAGLVIEIEHAPVFQARTTTAMTSGR